MEWEVSQRKWVTCQKVCINYYVLSTVAESRVGGEKQRGEGHNNRCTWNHFPKI